uniref:IST1-like protein n=1 Tax=Aegilops tauschii subsp. strangulata TaxID=200361 RepID=A0A453IGU4_AEGTS
MGFFTKSTSKQTAKLKSLVKLAVARLAVVRRPRLGRRSIARGDVAQLLSIGHLDRALARAEQVMEEDSMLEGLDIIEHYCKILVEHSAQLEKPKECGEEIKAAAAGLIFASARCGELPELLDARAILASKFGREFERAAKEGSQVVVNPTLVQRLSGQKASAEQQRRLAREIAAENGILLDFPDSPGEVHQSKQSEQAKNVPAPAPAGKSVEQFEVRTETSEVCRGDRGLPMIT